MICEAIYQNLSELVYRPMHHLGLCALPMLREIRRQQTVQRLKNQQGVLEDDSFADREPMKLLQVRSDVVLALHASDKLRRAVAF